MLVNPPKNREGQSTLSTDQTDNELKRMGVQIQMTKYLEEGTGAPRVEQIIKELSQLLLYFILI